MRLIMRQVIIYPGEDGWWVAECPSLPGCISQGKTREEATTISKKLFRDILRSLEQDNLPVPEESFEGYCGRMTSFRKYPAGNVGRHWGELAFL